MTLASQLRCSLGSSGAQYGYFYSRIYKIDFRLQCYIEFCSDTTYYLVRKFLDITPACPTSIYNHQRLAVINHSSSESHTLHTGFVDKPRRR